MKTLNKVTLMGYVGQQPEVHEYDGFKLMALWVATHERWKDRQGNYQSKTDWHKVIILHKGIISAIEDALKKKDYIYLEGHLRTRSWENEKGERQSSTEVCISGKEAKFQILKSALDPETAVA